MASTNLDPKNVYYAQEPWGPPRVWLEFETASKCAKAAQELGMFAGRSCLRDDSIPKATEPACVRGFSAKQIGTPRPIVTCQELIQFLGDLLGATIPFAGCKQISQSQLQPRPF